MPAPESTDVWTVRRIIEWTTEHLRKHGSETPRLEAEILLAHARNCPRIQLYVDFASPVTDAQRATMRDLVRRRAQSEPVAYLVGHREFFGLDFRVTPDVLVPRPETETLVLEAVSLGRKRGAGSAERGAEEGQDERRTSNVEVRILDVGTGSGCVAVACAVNLPGAQVTAIDLSTAALGIARDNAARHGVSDRVRFLEGDLFAPLAVAEQFDLIVSNPPYVADAEMETLPPDIRLHEPPGALRAGPQGLDVIARLIACAPPRLAAGGFLLIEISPEQASAVTGLLAAQGNFDPACTLKDAAGLARIVVARRKQSR